MTALGRLRDEAPDEALERRAPGDVATVAGPAPLPWLSALAVAGFVNAGNWKTSPLLSGVPFDLTLVLAALVVAVVGWRIITDGIPFPVAVVVAGFSLLVPPLLWTVSSAYADEKTLHLLTLTLLSALAPAVLVRTVEDARRLLTGYAAISLLTVVNVLVDPAPVATYRGAPLALPGVTTIAVGQSAAFVLLFAALAVIWKQRWSLLWAPPVAAAAILVMLQTGSRGPLLSAGGAMVVTVALLRPPLVRAGAVVGLVALAVTGLFARAPRYAQERIEQAAQGQVTGDILLRVRLFQAAVRSVGRDPFGIGWGGYERIAPEGYRYPHNLALELLTEAGVVFGGLFLAWVLLYYLWARRAGACFTTSVLLAGFSFALLGSTTSGDVNDNRAMFMLLGASVAIVHRTRARDRAGPP